MDWLTKLQQTLDEHAPGWETDWADQSDLREFLRSPQGARDISLLRARTAGRFHVILHAAIAAGVVEAKEEGSTC